MRRSCRAMSSRSAADEASQWMARRHPVDRSQRMAIALRRRFSARAPGENSPRGASSTGRRMRPIRRKTSTPIDAREKKLFSQMTSQAVSATHRSQQCGRQTRRIQHATGRAVGPASSLDIAVPRAIGIVVARDDEEINVGREPADGVADGSHRAASPEPGQVIVGDHEDARSGHAESAGVSTALAALCVSRTNTTTKTTERWTSVVRYEESSGSICRIVGTSARYTSARRGLSRRRRTMASTDASDQHREHRAGPPVEQIPLAEDGHGRVGRRVVRRDHETWN